LVSLKEVREKDNLVDRKVPQKGPRKHTHRGRVKKGKRTNKKRLLRSIRRDKKKIRKKSFIKKEEKKTLVVLEGKEIPTSAPKKKKQSA